MVLPQKIQERINELYSQINKKDLTSIRCQLTEKYKQSGTNKSIIETKNDSLVYAISRMPATYAVIFSLLRELKDENLLDGVSSAIDIGSGTGAGYLVLKEIFGDIQISLVERSKEMIEIFKTIVQENAKIDNIDIANNEYNNFADLVMASYVLSEMNEETRLKTVEKMLKLSNKYILLIDTGTPRTYENYLKIKHFILENGYNVLAPCATKNCALKNDYCQFFARVERTAIQKMSKEANLPYEDEKYFYLLISKQNKSNNAKRVIRRPIIKTNFVELKTCSCSGVEDLQITKKDKELYKKSRKIKINELL